jgi:hypothetical protein
MRDVLSEWVDSKGLELEENETKEDSPFEVAKGAPCNDRFTEFTYAIDLDRIEFRVDFNAIFNLGKIPRGPDHTEWINYLQLDGSGDRCLHPSTPRESISPHLPPTSHLIPEDAGSTYLANKPQSVDLTTWLRASDNRPVLDELSLFAIKAVIEDSYGALCVSCDYGPDGEHFQVPAKLLLTLLAPGILNIDNVLVRDRLTKEHPLYNFFNTRSDKPDPGNMPIRWWFRNCLIILASRLDESKFLPKWIGLAIQSARNSLRLSKETECTVILWSMQHAIVVKVSEAGVSHTPPFPVLDAFGRDESAFTTGVDLLMRCLQPSCIDITINHDKDTTSIAEDRSRVSLPFDVVMRVLDFAPPKTYNACSMLSRLYRANWAKHPRVGRYKLSQAKPDLARKDSAFPHTVWAIDCINAPTAESKRMFLFSVGSCSSVKRDRRFSSIYLHVPLYDPGYFRSRSPIAYYTPEFVPATISGLGARRDYILLEEDFHEHPNHLKHAFNRAKSETFHPRRRYERLNWPIEMI